MTQLKVVELIATTLERDSNFRGLVSTDWLGVGASYVVRASCRLQSSKGPTRGDRENVKRTPLPGCRCVHARSSMLPVWESGLSEGPDSLIKRVSEPGGTDGSIVFLGHFISRDAMTLAEIQALWAVAYMNGKLHKKTQKEMEEDVATEEISW